MARRNSSHSSQNRQDHDDRKVVDAIEPDDDTGTLDDGGRTPIDTAAVRTGSDTRSLGPSDSSDSGADFASGSAAAPDELVSDTDAAGTGERAGVGRHDGDDADTPIDRIVDADEAGLGAGSDEAV